MWSDRVIAELVSAHIRKGRVRGAVNRVLTAEDTENPKDRQQFKTTSPVIVVFVLEKLLGVNFLSFMQTQGDGHRLA